MRLQAAGALLSPARGLHRGAGQPCTIQTQLGAMATLEIRDERDEDIAGVRLVHEQAFGQPQEARLVDALRQAGGVLLSLVAGDGSAIVGHILFSPVAIASDKGRFAAVGLGPLAVLPAAQRKGVGSALVRAGLARLREAGHEAIVVLGHPEYYPRFGFRRASERGIRWEHEAPDEAFMVLELQPGSLAGHDGVVAYRPEFNDV